MCQKEYTLFKNTNTHCYVSVIAVLTNVCNRVVVHFINERGKHPTVESSTVSSCISGAEILFTVIRSAIWWRGEELQQLC